MLESKFSKEVIAARRDRRDRVKAGWEYVGEGGGMLWELYRGSRMGRRITHAEVAVDGLGVWVKVGERQPHYSLSPAPSNTPTVDHANHTGSAE